MRLAVVGSRDFRHLAEVRRFLMSMPESTIIVSGGAQGVDSAAASFARLRGLDVVEHLPDWKTWRMNAARVRNGHIARDCDELVAFWDGKSSGTRHVIECALRLGKPARAWIDGRWHDGRALGILP